MRYLLIIAALFCFASCDCHQMAKGKVIDSHTGLPIKGVKVTERSKPYVNDLTDEDGKFDLSSIHGICNGMDVRVERDGYIMLDTSIEQTDVTIALSRIQ